MSSKKVAASMCLDEEVYAPYVADSGYPTQTQSQNASSHSEMGVESCGDATGNVRKHWSRSSSRSSGNASKSNRAPWDMHSLKAAVSAAEVGTGQVEEAIRSSTFKPREQAFTKLISVCGRWKQTNKALEVFETMLEYHGVKANTITYTALISACSNAGDSDAARDVFHRMKVAAKSDPNCRPNQVTYSKIITASDNAGHYDFAVRCFYELEECGIVADQITYCSALHSSIEIELWEVAVMILSKMHDQEFAANVSDYYKMIDHYAENADWESALELFITMQRLEQQVDENCCAALMKAFESVAIADMAMELLRSMWEENINVTLETYMSAIRTLSAKRKWEHILRVMNKMLLSFDKIPKEAKDFILRTAQDSANRMVITRLEEFFADREV
eukprot:g4369.t1